MNPLKTIQHRFSHSLLKDQIAIEPLLTPDDRSAARTPLDIYKSAYYTRLIDALEQDYPVLQQLLGTERFRKTAHSYIEKYPSTSFTLRYFGQHLSAFIHNTDIGQQQPCLAELATFEWQLTDIFDLSDCPTACPDVMNRFKPAQWPHLNIQLHNSVRWLSLNWNISEIHLAGQTGANLPVPVRHPQPAQVLLWRKDYTPRYRVVSHTEKTALQMLETRSFAQLCQFLADQSDDQVNPAMAAAIYLKSWLSAGLISAVESQ